MGIIDSIKDAVGIMDDIGDYTDSISKVMRRADSVIQPFLRNIDYLKKALKEGELINTDPGFAKQFKVFYSLDDEIKRVISRLQYLQKSLLRKQFLERQKVATLINKHIVDLNTFVKTYKDIISKIEALESLYKKNRNAVLVNAAVFLGAIASISLLAGYWQHCIKESLKSADGIKKEVPITKKQLAKLTIKQKKVLRLYDECYNNTIGMVKAMMRFHQKRPISNNTTEPAMARYKLLAIRTVNLQQAVEGKFKTWIKLGKKEAMESLQEADIDGQRIVLKKLLQLVKAPLAFTGVFENFDGVDNKSAVFLQKMRRLRDSTKEVIGRSIKAINDELNIAYMRI